MATALLRSVRLLMVLSVLTVGSTAAGSGAPRDNPRLASLQIEIWPEYDRAAAALVILPAEIAAGVALPATVSLRLATTTGGPSAVAYSSGPGSDKLNLKYSRSNAEDFITVKFEIPERFFHVEFYEPLVTTASGRNYTYVWPGDLAAERLNVLVQEPAAASNLAVQPALGAATLGQDGLRYQSADLGPLKAGEHLPVQVRYVKTDARTSTEILKPVVPEPSPPPVAGPSKGELAGWLAAGVAVLVLTGIAASTWWSRRKGSAQPGPQESGFCRKCRTPTASGDRFCSKCGAPLA